MCCSCMSPCTFRNVSLSKHVNSHCLVLSRAPVHIHKDSGSYVHFCPRPCLSTCRWARLATHRHSGPHSVCILCSCAHFGRVTIACVIAKRDWAVSVGFCRTRGISQEPPCPLFDTVHVRKPRSKKLAIFSCETSLSFVSVPTRVFRYYHTHMHSSQCAGRNHSATIFFHYP